MRLTLLPFACWMLASTSSARLAGQRLIPGCRVFSSAMLPPTADLEGEGTIWRPSRRSMGPWMPCQGRLNDACPRLNATTLLTKRSLHSPPPLGRGTVQLATTKGSSPALSSHGPKLSKLSSPDQ